MSLDLSKGREPLLPDERVERLAEKLRSEFGHRKLEDATFLTFISEAREATAEVNGLKVPTWVQPMATFAVVEPNPRPYAKAKGLQLMTHGTVALEDWEEDEKAYRHYVGRPDPAHRIFKLVVADHVARIQSLKEMI